MIEACKSTLLRTPVLLGALAGGAIVLPGCSSDSGGCKKDTDCAAGRICGSNGSCTYAQSENGADSGSPSPADSTDTTNAAPTDTPYDASTDTFSDASSDTSALFTGSWLCTLTLVEDGITDGYPTAFKTTATGNGSLSIFAEKSDSVEQSWFCGFNYVISGLSASLVGMPVCNSNSRVTLHSAIISVTADGNKLSLEERGDDYDSNIPQSSPGTISGTCSRN